MIESFRDEFVDLPPLLVGHVLLTVLAVLCGTAISVAVGIIASRSPKLQTPLLGAAGVIQTIPSIAMLAIMFPIFGRIGFLPAFVALVLYSMLPILRNTVIGIAEVDRSAVEAARAVGMTDGQMLFRVQLPLAAPIIIGGIRTATVWTVGMAALASPIGARSLGEYIFSGLQTRSIDAVLFGCVTAALLAIVLDNLIHALEFGVKRRRWGVVIGALVVLSGITGSAAAYRFREALGLSGRSEIRIAAKTFTEQFILAELLRFRLRSDTDYAPTVRRNLGSTVAFDALSIGQIDTYVDYSGTIWATVLKRADRVPRQEMIDVITERLRDDYDIIVVGPLGFENAYRFAMPRSKARELGIETTTDLIREAPGLHFGTDVEFVEREEYEDLISKHGLKFGRVTTMQSVLMYEAVKLGQVDVIAAYTTDGRIRAYDLALIEDDVRAFPPYDALILLSGRSAREKPGLRGPLEALVGTIDDATMQKANWEVDEKRRAIATVARELLDAVAPASQSAAAAPGTQPSLSP